MATIRTYRKTWTRLHKRYEKKAYNLLIKTFRSWARSIDFDSLTVVNYNNVITQSVDSKMLTNNYQDIFIQTGLAHGAKVGKSINQQLKLFTLENFASVFLDNILQWLEDEGGQRIISIEQTFIEDINNIITKGLNEGLTIREISRDLQSFVNRPDFYRWQALRIARTETTMAANRAALMAGEVAGFVTNKVWISAQDKRTRRTPPDAFDHLNMDGVQVGINEQFNVSGEPMEYPGDPGINNSTSAGNVINCRCTVAIIAARDRQGNLIPTT